MRNNYSHDNTGNGDQYHKRRRSRSGSPLTAGSHHYSNNGAKDYPTERNDRSFQTYNKSSDYNHSKYQTDMTEGRVNYYDNEFPRSSYDAINNEGSDFDKPSTQVIIKGLPSHTTESSLLLAIAAYGVQSIIVKTNRDTGECKGFAFVDFPSIEYSQYFMKAFGGSCVRRDINAPTLIIDSKVVTIDYAKGLVEKSSHTITYDHANPKKFIRADWICEKCSCQNFARRNECFRCSHMKTENSIITNHVTPGLDGMASDMGGISMVPTSFLLVKGFNLFATEEQLSDLFRQYALVRDCLIIRDRTSGISKGIAIIAFHSIDFATFAMNAAISAGISIEKTLLRINYANEVFYETQKKLSYDTVGQLNWSMNFAPSVSVSTGVIPATLPVVVKPSSKPIWPPYFETNGALYTFQASSGYFYESISQYYYCTKSKLYYNTINGNYYSCDLSSGELKFSKTIPPLPTESYEVALANLNASQQVAVSEASTEVLSSLNKKPVIINLGVKAKAKPIVISSNKTNTGMKSALDIAKWESKKQELKEDNQETLTSSDKSVPIKSIVLSTPSSNTKTVPSNSFICYVCKRALNSAELLARHEKESKLHLENVAKAAVEAATRTEETKDDASSHVVYRDRASERRSIHGSSDSYPAQVDNHTHSTEFDTLAPSSHENLSSANPLQQNVSVSIGSDLNNPGNLLLRKMGWEEGKGLGKDESGIEAPIQVKAQISSTAGIGVSVLPSVNYSDRNEKKASILQITKARFDQTN